jgi:hypothetical protein
MHSDLGAETLSTAPLSPYPLPLALAARSLAPRKRTRWFSAQPRPRDCQRHVLHRSIGIALATVAEDCLGASEIPRRAYQPSFRFGDARQPRGAHAR